MKRYDLELTATGPVMEESEDGAFVPFSEISGLADTIVKMGSHCTLLADLLREARSPLITAMEVSSEDESAAVEELIGSIDSVLAGKCPDRANLPTWYLDGAKDFKSMMLEATRAIFHPHIEGVFAVFERQLALDAPQGGEPLQAVSPPLKLMIQITDILKMCRSALITALQDVQDDAGKGVIQYRIKLATKAINMAEHAIDAAQGNSGRFITEGQEFELTTVLQSIANGFSDDPAHDAASLLKRIAGEVPWTGDSFQLPPRQGGEPCATEPRSFSPD